VKPLAQCSRSAMSKRLPARSPLDRHAHALAEGPKFQTAYQEARRAAYGQAVARLQQGASAAATTMLKTMIDPNAGIHSAAGGRSRNESRDEGHRA
jgi:hypothetical protein